MLATDGRRQFVEAIERIVGDLQVDKRDVHTIGVDDAVVSQVSKMLDVGRRFVEIVHTFVKTCMCGSFDGRAAKVKVIHDLQRAGVSKENAKAGVWNDTTVASGSWADMDAAPERSKLGQVGKRSTTHFERTHWRITVIHKIVEANVVVECIRPKIRL
jgi:hypothetical protein